MDFNDKYSRVNNSFRRKCIFRIGVSEGFFSELNNMIFALLYCMENKTQFILTDAGANFASWSQIPYEEYFTPFCKINRDKIHKRFNVRDRGVASSFRKKNTNSKYGFIKQQKG